MKEYKKLSKLGYGGITLRDLFDKESAEFNSTNYEEKVAKIENLISKGIDIKALIYEYMDEYRNSSKPYVAKDIYWALVSLIEYKSGEKKLVSFRNSTDILISVFSNLFNGKGISESDKKKLKYENLVSERKRFDYETDEIINPSKLGLENDSHLNAWAYWHGNLDADIIIIGQDFGSVDYYITNKGLDEANNQTNINLRNLCMNLNIDLGTFDNPKKAPVYLTNAVLGAKKGNMSEGIKTSWYATTQHLTKQLIEIISPKYIITLGSVPLDLMKRIYKLKIGTLKTEIDKNPIQLDNGIKFFAVYHCSNLGIANRKMELQMEDWKGIGKMLK